MLTRVPLAAKALDDYRAVVGDATVDALRAAAAPLVGARVLHLNATAYGGGVAELLATHVALLRDVGVDAEWHVMRGSDEFFGITKQIHNALQGAPVAWTNEHERVYLETVLDNASAFEGSWDFVVVHDPQPAALPVLLDHLGANPGRARWVWRCHIDLTAADPTVWGFLAPYVERYDASVWTMREFVPSGVDDARVTIAPPCIDPLSVKSLDLGRPFVEEICRQYGIDPTRPLLCQVSRFDPWKDPLGVIEVWRQVRTQVPGTQLLLAGSMATDDPEGFSVWEQVEAARAKEPDVHVLSNLQQVGNVQINAFQSAADVVLQKSLREGFGLTVAEAMWKGRPVIGGNVGGITTQIRDGVDGYLVDSVAAAATRAVTLLEDPRRADAMGACGRERVRGRFCATRELGDWLALFAGLR